MKRQGKRLCSLLLAAVIAAACLVPALAAPADDARRKAEALGELNLFRGTEQGLELDRAPTRMEALVMLLRLSGQEWKALQGEKTDHPFTDAPAWRDADAYLGYAYGQGLAKGRTATEFDPAGPADAQMYVTFVLRALGYQDTEDGSVYDRWQTLARQAGILPEGVSTADFRRGDVALVSYAALDAQMQDGSGTLAEFLLKSRLVSDVSLSTARALAGKTVAADSPLADVLGAVYAGADVATTRLTTTVLTQENLSYFLGVNQLAFTEGLACEPMMSSTAHSVCLVRLKDGSDVEQVKRDIAGSVNPYKWICAGVEQENVRVDSIGNLVILVMDNSAPDRLMANFRALGATGGLSQVNGTYVQSQKAVEPASVSGFARKLQTLRTEYFPSNPVFYATIPDKSWYVGGISQLDHEDIVAQLARELPDWKTVSLAQTLSLTDYYGTDPHWRQERLLPTVELLGGAMGFTVEETAFTAQEREGFAGAYRLLDSSLPTETVSWLTSRYTQQAVVRDVEHPAVSAVYNPALLDSQSPYDLFLSGPSPLIEIENPLAPSQRELVIFRDSFGSSIAPLLLEPYSKVTLVDLRYMASALLPDYVEFAGADILFLYSDQMVNNSALLK